LGIKPKLLKCEVGRYVAVHMFKDECAKKIFTAEGNGNAAAALFQATAFGSVACPGLLVSIPENAPAVRFAGLVEVIGEEVWRPQERAVCSRELRLLATWG